MAEPVVAMLPYRKAQLAWNNLDDIERFAEKIAQSAFVPKEFRGKPGDVLAAIVYGMERGLSPMSSLQNIAVINGRPSIFGDMLLAICLDDGSTEYIREAEQAEIVETRVAWCEAKRKGRGAIRRTFSQADAERARLWTKDGPWTQYPERMLLMRARSWCLRDAFADRLMGLSTREEAGDIIDVTPADDDPATAPLVHEVKAADAVPPDAAPGMDAYATALLAHHEVKAADPVPPQPLEHSLPKASRLQGPDPEMERLGPLDLARPEVNALVTSVFEEAKAIYRQPTPAPAPKPDTRGEQRALVAAVASEVERLAGDDPDLIAYVLQRALFGPDVHTIAEVSTLAPVRLRGPLDLLRAMPTPAGPPPTDEAPEAPWRCTPPDLDVADGYLTPGGHATLEGWCALWGHPEVWDEVKTRPLTPFQGQQLINMVQIRVAQDHIGAEGDLP